VQRYPRLSATLADYDRVLKQRGALLKSARARRLDAEALPTLDVWDDKLVALGVEIIRAREALVRDLAGPIADAYASIAGADHAPDA
ncbi:MAG TPA: DNA replication and repair protein RecF, partial [Microbacterium sp.]|nr:DNA replication and repair protein RecF [Microbacterium sp.]